MTITLADCAEHIEHTLSGPSVLPSVVGLVNQTGEHMVGMHQWMFLRRPPARLAARASITISSASYTHATKTVTRFGAFTNYTFLAGDTFECDAGTGATVGFYKIASKVSANAITLETSLGAAADAQTDIGGTLDLSSVALPSDFGSIQEITSGADLLSYVELTTMAELARLRDDSSATIGGGYCGAIAFGQPITGGAPVPRLELWPAPQENDPNAFLLQYRAKWATVDDDTLALSLPTHVEGLYLTLLRAFARGYEEEDQATLSQRLAEIEQGPVFASARKHDGGHQRNYGRISGGWRSKRSGPSYQNIPLGGAS